MGRNNDTFTLVIERNKEMWSKFRRALRKEDQLLFDELWRAPKLHLAAGAFLAHETPLETIFMSMLLEQYKKIKLLEAKQQHALIPTSPSTQEIQREDSTANPASSEDEHHDCFTSLAMAGDELCEQLRRTRKVEG